MRSTETSGEERVGTGVRGERRYRSPLRQERAAGTRRRIATAALDLFAEHGFGRTTVTAVTATACAAVLSLAACSTGMTTANPVTSPSPTKSHTGSSPAASPLGVGRSQFGPRGCTDRLVPDSAGDGGEVQHALRQEGGLH